MKTINETTANDSNNSENRPLEDSLAKRIKRRRNYLSRRSFLRKSLVAGAGTLGVGLLGRSALAQGGRARLLPGDAALLRFPAALETLEADFWIQYNELGGIPDPEVPGGTGNPDYTEALAQLDEDMDQYIHDNTDDEITHYQFLNAYLVSKGAAPANLDPFRTTFRRRSQLWRLTSTQQFPGLMRTQRILISYRRSRILRLSTFQPLNKVATASTHR